MNLLCLEKIVAQALEEDLGTGDITTQTLVSDEVQTRGLIHSKDNGVLAGVEIARLVFQRLDQRVTFVARKKDGQLLQPGDPIAEVFGSAQGILSGERVALNFLQRLSGIATRTRHYLEKVKDYPVTLVDTRKTTPGLRILEKYAVRVGGGTNHRFGLYDAVLIKDNHLRLAGGIQAAVAQVRRQLPHTMRVEVEVETLEELEEALAAGVDIILLDNMEPALLQQAVAINQGRACLEASGGINLDTLVTVAASGVDLISVGAFTHSVQALDFSLDIEV